MLRNRAAEDFTTEDAAIADKSVTTHLQCLIVMWRFLPMATPPARSGGSLCHRLYYDAPLGLRKGTRACLAIALATAGDFGLTSRHWTVVAGSAPARSVHTDEHGLTRTMGRRGDLI